MAQIGLTRVRTDAVAASPSAPDGGGGKNGSANSERRTPVRWSGGEIEDEDEDD
jgi:hypothetical protein